MVVRGLVAPALAAQWAAALGDGPSRRLDDPLRFVPHLGPRPPGADRLLASQCWVRHGDPAHHWHQDGALHHDFRAAAAPLPLWTCWIALTRCGDDAPGLEWIDAPAPALLLAPPELADAALRARFPAVCRPVCAPGDAVWFDGARIHRTAVAGPRRRTSIELRFVPAGPLPARLAGETVQSIGRA